MSSTSTNTWFSKIAISQHVVRRMFPEAMSAAARAADRVHADWQRQPGCGAHAMCDQIHSTTGVTCTARKRARRGGWGPLRQLTRRHARAGCAAAHVATEVAPIEAAVTARVDGARPAGDRPIHTAIWPDTPSM